MLGRRIPLDGRSYTVIGVMPRAFRFPNRATELWTPIGFDPARIAARQGGYSVRIVARLRAETGLRLAQAQLDQLGRLLEARYPREYRGPQGQDGGWRITATPLKEQIVGQVWPKLLLLGGTVMLLLLIACANVAGLLAARAAGRRREFAIRAALGAGRRHIARQLFAETILLASAAGGLGLMLAAWCVDAVRALRPAGLPRVEDIAVDARVAVFAAAAALVTALVFGILPAFRAARPAWQAGRGIVIAGARRALIVAEVALSLVLLSGAGLLARSFIRLQGVDPGFEARNVVTARLALLDRYSPQRAAAFFAQLADRIRALPGVEAASAISNAPLAGGRQNDPFSIEGRDFTTASVASYLHAGEDYFAVLRIPLLRGRAFDARDAAGREPVAVVNARLAAGFFSGEDPLGKRIKMGAPSAPTPWRTIVGVTGDVRYRGLDADAGPQIYVPISQEPARNMTVLARTAGDPRGASPALAAAAAALDSDLPVTQLRTMEEVLADSVAGRRFQATLRLPLPASSPGSASFWPPPESTEPWRGRWPGAPGRSGFAWRSAPLLASSRGWCCATRSRSPAWAPRSA